MIYGLNIEMYPKADHTFEEIAYKDQNGFAWKVSRIKNGLIIGYFGDDYFSPKTFECKISDSKSIRIKNTKCFFINNTEFDVFAEFREILKEGYTDDIWECIEEFFTERLTNDPGILKEEII